MIGKYKPRIADAILEQKLEGKGAVLIEGPKWCGKTTTAEQIAKTHTQRPAGNSLRVCCFSRYSFTRSRLRVYFRLSS